MASNTALINWATRQIKILTDERDVNLERARVNPSLSRHYSIKMAAAAGAIDAYTQVLDKLGVKYEEENPQSPGTPDQDAGSGAGGEPGALPKSPERYRAP